MLQDNLKKIIIKLSFISFIFLVTVNHSYAQNEGDQYLKSLQNKFNTIKDFTASITQTIDGKPSLSGKIYFKTENNFKIEFGNSIIVSDGISSWNLNKKENKVIITDYAEDESLFSINYLVYQFPSQCTLKGESDGKFRKLTLTPKSRTSNFGEVTLWINNDDLIEKIQTYDSASGLMELNFSNIIINKNIPVSYFQFSPPQESKIIDLR